MTEAAAFFIVAIGGAMIGEALWNIASTLFSGIRLPRVNVPLMFWRDVAFFLGLGLFLLLII